MLPGKFNLTRTSSLQIDYYMVLSCLLCDQLNVRMLFVSPGHMIEEVTKQCNRRYLYYTEKISYEVPHSMRWNEMHKAASNLKGMIPFSKDSQFSMPELLNVKATLHVVKNTRMGFTFLTLLDAVQIASKLVMNCYNITGELK